MSRQSLKQFFAGVIKVVAGGPTDRTRGAGLLGGLYQFIDQAVLQSDLSGDTVNVRPYTADIDDWQQGELCTATVTGTEGFYRAKLAGGPFPAPTGPDDAYWRQTAAPAGITTQYQAITLALARNLLADGEAIQPIRYRILRGAAGDVDVLGIAAAPNLNAAAGFSPQGVWLDPADFKLKQVSYDLVTDATAPVGDDALLPVTATRTANYTLALADAGCLVPLASSAPLTLTVPTNAAVPFPVGTVLYVAQDGAGAVTVAAAPGVVVHVADGAGLKVPGQWSDVSLHKRGTDTWVLKGGVS